MSNIDGDTPEFDDLNMHSDGMPDPTAPAQTADIPLAENIAAVDDSLQSVEHDPVGEDDADKPAVAKKDGLGTILTQASPYTMMLAISVMAIGVALLCLIFEWNTYSFQRKPPKNLTMSRVENVQFLAVSKPHNDLVTVCCEDIS